MKKEQYNLVSLSPDVQVRVAIGIVISNNLTGKGSNFIVETTKDKKDVEVPVTLVEGEFDLVRPKLHAMLDEWLDQYEMAEIERNPNTERRYIKSVSPADGKPFVWSPKGSP